MFSTGYVLAIWGTVMAALIPGIGSALSVSKAGQTVAGLTAEQHKSFFRAFVISLLPATQGLYGFVVAIMINNKISAELTMPEGWGLFLAALPVAIGGFFSAIYQSNIARASIQLLSKQPNSSARGMMLTGIVEMYAILGFVISMFILNNV